MRLPAEAFILDRNGVLYAGMKAREPFMGRPQDVAAFKDQLRDLFEVEGIGFAGSLGRFAIRWALEPDQVEPFNVTRGIGWFRRFRDLDPVVPRGLEIGDVAYVTSMDGRPAPIDVRHQVSFLFLHKGQLAFRTQAAAGASPLSFGLDFLPPTDQELHVRDLGDVQVRTVTAGVQGLFGERGEGGRRYDRAIAEYAGFLARVSQRPELAHELASAQATAAVRGLNNF